MLTALLVLSNAHAATVQLDFAADWSQTASAPIVQGDTVHITYDSDRLTDCRASSDGVEAWAIQAHWQFNGGPIRETIVTLPADQPEPIAQLPALESGALELWFSNIDADGCIAWDSNFGANYTFTVDPEPGAPGWMGNVQSVISRATCGDGEPCWDEAVPINLGFTFDSWARERAATTVVSVDVWEPGVTDWDNPDVWSALDVQIHWRFDRTAPLEVDYVDFATFVGNDARFSYDLRAIDPFPGVPVVDVADCPAAPTRLSQDGLTLQTRLQFYFTVNGSELRPSPTGFFTGNFSDGMGFYQLCP